MINETLLNLICKYESTNIVNVKNAIKEILQNIILVGLEKGKFFNVASFYGGTSLRILRGLPRFSEDLDFTLLCENSEFNFDEYLSFAEVELNSFGIECDVAAKEKKVETTVESRYFKFNLKRLLDMTYPEYAKKVADNELLTIKVEIEKKTFDGYVNESKILTSPSFCLVKTFTMDTLFASKLLAVLYRKWGQRVKGRDFYDYLFYIKNHTKVNLKFLENGLKAFGHLQKDEELSLDLLKQKLLDRFSSIDFEKCKEDVLPFVKKGDPFIDSFKKEMFLASVDLIDASFDVRA
ncbi:MAG: nucleotidyl transferase AbiEii/AbiGii toxin family protein [Bacilli bacterium]|nr:nucleotidyl transferase AbiEii/AbiGii toxin family protein [Bacilli bacterium]